MSDPYRSHSHRHINACLKACAGIPTEALEGASVKALIDLLKQLQRYMDGVSLWHGGWINHPETPETSPDQAVNAALAPFLKGDDNES